MVVPAAKRDDTTLQRQVNQLQRSTKTVQQRPPRAEPIHLRAGHALTRGGGWKRFLVGNEEKALCSTTNPGSYIRLRINLNHPHADQQPSYGHYCSWRGKPGG